MSGGLRARARGPSYRAVPLPRYWGKHATSQLVACCKVEPTGPLASGRQPELLGQATRPGNCHKAIEEKGESQALKLRDHPKPIAIGSNKSRIHRSSPLKSPPGSKKIYCYQRSQQVNFLSSKPYHQTDCQATKATEPSNLNSGC